MTMINHDAEVAVLGSLLVDGTLIRTLTLQPEHFYHIHHRKIFEAMVHAEKEKQCIDFVIVTTYLGNDIQEIGGVSYLSELTESIATTANILHHEQLIKDSYRNRKSREIALHFSKNPTEQGLDALIKNLQALQDEIAITTEKSTFDYLIELTEDMFANHGPTGWLSSYNELDDMTGGWQKGDLIIVAARPSVGKTAFALNLAANHCTNGYATTIISLEMGTKHLLQRMISAKAHINNQKWRNALFSETDYKRASIVVGQMAEWNLKIFDKKRTISDIRSTIRQQIYHQQAQKHLIIIDYLQLITPTKQYDREDIAIGEITRELKLLAIELDIPIILISQLSRGVESRQNKRPLMSDLRGSGNIEQDADVIMFLYRDTYYEKGSNNESTVEVILSKQRNGPVGTVELGFHSEYGEFINATET
ncbi:replicative DNA helicase [Gracilibacillus marinus]|uniref:DNA 5'-3' helicase n=1 Tax=Gracilibacillus marinus TaxID=630535 RepID=A0ABV8VTX5_9BACI